MTDDNHDENDPKALTEVSDDDLTDDLLEELEDADPTNETDSAPFDMDEMDVTEQEFVSGRMNSGRSLSEWCEQCGELVQNYVRDEDSGRVLCYGCSVIIQQARQGQITALELD